MTREADLEWWRAEHRSQRIAFAFAFQDGKVVKCAPIGRKYLMGRTKRMAALVVGTFAVGVASHAELLAGRKKR